MSSSSKQLDIAIVGGGVTGLVCAVALAKRGVYAHVYESKPLFDEVGVGLGLGPNALRVLEEIGVLRDALTASGETHPTMIPFLFLSGMDGHEVIYDYPRAPDDVSAGLPRYSFVKALAAHIDPTYAHFSKKCIDISTSNTNPPRSVLHFSDGTSAEADVVLVANGVKSSVRGAVTGTQSTDNLAFGNTICYRAVVSPDQARASGVKTDLSERPVCFMGEDKHFIIFPIKGGELINIVAFAADRTIKIGDVNLPPERPTVVPASVKEMLEVYDGWGNDVVRLLGCMIKANKWYVNVVYPPLKTYVKGKVALMGDAAHGMLPHLGAGAGQGIEDAYLIAQLLSLPEANGSNVETLLRVYDEVRRPRALSVWEGSVRQGDNYDWRGKSGPSREGVRKDLAGSFDFVWNYPVHEDFKKAASRLQELGPHGSCATQVFDASAFRLHTFHLLYNQADRPPSYTFVCGRQLTILTADCIRMLDSIEELRAVQSDDLNGAVTASTLISTCFYRRQRIGAGPLNTVESPFIAAESDDSPVIIKPEGETDDTSQLACFTFRNVEEMAEADIPKTMIAYRFIPCSLHPVREEVAVPPIAPDQVLVQILASGVCHTDLSLLDPENVMNTYMTTTFTLGHEGAGTVVALGSAVPDLNPGIKIGTYVAVYGLNACFEPSCPACSSGCTNLCMKYRSFGLGIDGCWAKYLALRASCVVPVPADPQTLPPAIVAVATDAVLTPYHALKACCRVQPGQTVLCLGVGGVGLNAVAIAKSCLGAGCVVACDTRESTLTLAAEMGADYVVHPDGLAGLIAEQSLSIDVAVDFVGTQSTFDQCFQAVRHSGTIHVVGLAGPPISLVPTVMMVKDITVKVSSWGTKAELAEVLQVILDGKIKPKVELRSMDECGQVLKEMKEVLTDMPIHCFVITLSRLYAAVSDLLRSRSMPSDSESVHSIPLASRCELLHYAARHPEAPCRTLEIASEQMTSHTTTVEMDTEDMPKTMIAYRFIPSSAHPIEEEVLVPSIAPDQVLVRVLAGGVCHSDLSVLDPENVINSYMTAPFTLGHEGAGIVVAVGSAVPDSNPEIKIGACAPLDTRICAGHTEHLA
ncbi:hypothetical protein NM688_g857 [Phlebia brevispora]|uniref:Uncharacterized protein n=1 Tax=Phlebia brevispora TaxID=194682 RepID=A0ACC1TDD4_9APHY|nr:hypothetical protein NM688_g857 [Phlebia brevispora]